MKILDWYILKRYLGTFIMMLALFIPIMIIVNLAEKIDKMLANEVPFLEILSYYGDFTIYFLNILFPFFLFLSVIWFTSKLANNTEVIAFLSSGVSFTRFLRPYLIGATIVCAAAFVLGTYIGPSASRDFKAFEYEYLKKKKDRETQNVYRLINDNDLIYVSSFSTKSKTGRNFTLEHIEGNELKYKLSASRIRFNPKDTTYTLNGYKKKVITPNGDILFSQRKLDTTFTFDIDDLTPVEYIAETLTTPELRRFIEKERARGSSNISGYEVTLYKRFGLPVAAYILTIIAVAVSSMKRRGGMGVNLLVGIVIACSFLFFDRIFSTMANQSDFSPLVAVWLPNVVFAILAAYLLYNAKR